MIKKIRNSLTVKICVLMAALLLISSGITYAAVVRFLPTYYSKQLQKDLDIVVKEMVKTIQSYATIEEASYAISLFEAGSQVNIVIFDDRGEQVWPMIAMVEETAVSGAAAAAVQISEYEISSVDAVVEEETTEAYPEAEEDQAVEYGTVWDADAMASEEYGNPSAAKQYDFTLGEEQYVMLVFGGMEPVNQAMGILRRIFPYILGIAIAAAMIFAAGASLYLTMPVVKLSRISKRMATLDFGSLYQGKRTDEIGALGRDLNELSQNLSCALEELVAANAKLKSDIDREREQEKKRIAFFSAVSHELKTPITILKGHLAGMLQGIGEYKNRDYYLRRSLETSEQMEDMVKELLTVSRMENRPFWAEQTDIAELFRQKIADMTELMENKKMDLRVSIPEHLYAEVNPGMMEKVFSNLLMNAIRHTPAGEGQEIRVHLQSGEEEGQAVLCQVENTGVSIPEEAIPHVFEAFYRVEQSRNRQTGGSGLGLYIVKMILEQHGASYGIKNTRDGVCFFFSLEMLPEQNP